MALTSLWLSIFPKSVAMAETFAFNTQEPGMEIQKPFLTTYYTCWELKVYFEPQKLKNDIVLLWLSLLEAVNLDCLKI